MSGLTESEIDKLLAARLADLAGRVPAGRDEDGEALRRSLRLLNDNPGFHATTSMDKVVDRAFYTYKRGAQEYAGHVFAELGRTMGGDLSLKDQETLYEFQQRLERDLKRRYPQFDIETEVRRHT